MTIYYQESVTTLKHPTLPFVFVSASSTGGGAMVMQIYTGTKRVIRQHKDISEGNVTSMKLSDNGRVLYVGTSIPGSTMHMYDVKTGTKLDQVLLFGETDFMSSVQPASNNMVLATCSGGTAYEMSGYDVKQRKVVWHRQAPGWKPGVAFDRRRNLVYIGYTPKEGRVARVDPATGEDVDGDMSHFKTDKQSTAYIHFDEELDVLSTIGFSPWAFAQYNCETGERLRSYSGTPLGGFNALRFRFVDHGRIIFLLGYGKTVNKFSVADGSLLQTYACKTTSPGGWFDMEDGLMAVSTVDSSPKNSKTVSLFDIGAGDSTNHNDGGTSKPIAEFPLPVGTWQTGLVIANRTVYVPYQSTTGPSGVLVIDAQKGEEPTVFSHPSHVEPLPCSLAPLVGSPGQFAASFGNPRDVWRLSASSGSFKGRLLDTREQQSELSEITPNDIGAALNYDLDSAWKDEVATLQGILESKADDDSKSNNSKGPGCVVGLWTHSVKSVWHRALDRDLLFVHTIAQLDGGSVVSVFSMVDPKTGQEATEPEAWPWPRVRLRSDVHFSDGHVCFRRSDTTKGKDLLSAHVASYNWKGELKAEYKAYDHMLTWDDPKSGQFSALTCFTSATVKGYTPPTSTPARLPGEVEAGQDWKALLIGANEQRREFGEHLRARIGKVSGSEPGSFSDSPTAETTDLLVMAIVVREGKASSSPNCVWGDNVILVFNLNDADPATPILRFTTGRPFNNARHLSIIDQHVAIGIDRGESRAFLYSLRTGALWARLGGAEVGRPMSFSAKGSSGTRIVLGTSTGEISEWEIEPETAETAVTAVRPLNADNGVDKFKRVMFDRCREGTLIKSYNDHGDAVNSVYACPSTGRLVSCSSTVVGRSVLARETLGIRMMWSRSAEDARKPGLRASIRHFARHYGPLWDMFLVLLFLIIDLIQMSAFAFVIAKDGDDTWMPDTPVFNSLTKLQSLGIVQSTSYSLRVGIAVVFGLALSTLFLVKELVQWRIVFHPTRLAVAAQWEALNLCVRLLTGPAFLFVFSTLAATVDCTDDQLDADTSIECYSDDEHKVMVAAAAVGLFCLLPLTIRYSLVGGDLIALDVRSNLFDWSGDRRASSSDEDSGSAEVDHPLVQENAVYGLSLMITKLLLTALILYLTRYTLLQVIGELVMAAALVAASFWLKPFFSHTANRVVGTLYMGVFAVYLTGFFVRVGFFSTDDATYIAAPLIAIVFVLIALVLSFVSLCRAGEGKDVSDSDESKHDAVAASSSAANVVELVEV